MLEDALLANNAQAGLMVHGEGSRAELRRVRVTDTRSVGLAARGVQVQDGGEVRLSETWLSHNAGAGLVVHGGRAYLHRTAVEANTVADSGDGVAVVAGGHLEADGILIANHPRGLVVVGSTADVRDSELRGNRQDLVRDEASEVHLEAIRPRAPDPDASCDAPCAAPGRLEPTESVR